MMKYEYWCLVWLIIWLSSLTSCGTTFFIELWSLYVHCIVRLSVYRCWRWLCWYSVWSQAAAARFKFFAGLWTLHGSWRRTLWPLGESYPIQGFLERLHYINLRSTCFLMRYSCCRYLWHCCRLSVVCHGCIVAKWCEIEHRLLFITNRQSHVGFQMTCKSLTLDDFESQYCNRNCIGCSMSFLATAGLSCLLTFQHAAYCN